MIDKFLRKLGLIRVRELHYARTVAKRLDEHREEVEAIASETDLFERGFWHANNMAKQDDYLMRLYRLAYGFWPDGEPIIKSKVRPRPTILGECQLPEYQKESRVK